MRKFQDFFILQVPEEKLIIINKEKIKKKQKQ
jgi:hypothetical protein